MSRWPASLGLSKTEGVTPVATRRSARHCTNAPPEQLAQRDEMDTSMCRHWVLFGQRRAHGAPSRGQLSWNPGASLRCRTRRRKASDDVFIP